jgi:hypothetical protein
MSSEKKIFMTGDINLMGLGDAEIVFDLIKPRLAKAAAVLSNLECCFYEGRDTVHNQDDTGHFYLRSGQREGFYAKKSAISALTAANISIVGNANNCNYGDEAIRSTISVLNKQQIPFSGVGANWEKACEPAIFQTEDLKIGFLQRTSVYWPNNHEASALNPGVATLKVHTAYSPEIDGYAANRPGSPPRIHTWVDQAYLADFTSQIQKLSATSDITVVSLHWGYKDEVLEYMREAAHAAIDAGADIVMGHGPHTPLPIEFYRSKPIFYGLGSFVFHHGHRGKTHGSWLGLMGQIKLNRKNIAEVGFCFVRRNEQNQTYVCNPIDEQNTLDALLGDLRKTGCSIIIHEQDVFIKEA